MSSILHEYRGLKLEVTVLGCYICSSEEAYRSRPLYVYFKYGDNTYITESTQDHGGINTAYPNEFKFTLIQGQSELKFVVWKNIRTNFDYNDFMGSGRVQLRNVDVSKGYEEYCCFLQKGINRDVTGELRLVLKCTHAHSKKYDPSSSSAKSAPQGYPQHPHSSRNFSEDPISAPSWTPRCHHPAPYPPPPSYCPPPPVNYQAPYQPPPQPPSYCPPPPVNYQPPYQPPPPPPPPVNYQAPYQPPPPPPSYCPPPPVNYQPPYQPPPPPPVYYQPPYQPPPPLHYPSQYTVQPPPSTPPPLSQFISVIHLLASVASIEANLSQFFES